MPVVIGEHTKNDQATPYVKRMIRCPGHYLIPPDVDIYLREPVPWANEISDKVELRGQTIKLRKERIAVDAFGRKLVDWKKLYRLRKVGKVVQPLVSAAWCIENIYDPMSELCQVRCRLNAGQPCKEGQGRIMTMSINRLNGRKCRDR